MSDEKIPEIINSMLKELEQAEKLHPVWPEDKIHAGAIVAEEAGELLQVCNDYQFEHYNKDHLIKEALQTGAMAIRFLKNL